MQILTRLNAKAGISEGFGGIPDLTTSDIAAALYNCNKPGLMVLLAKVCGEGDYKAIYEVLFPQVLRRGFREKWRLRPSDEARAGKLLEIAIKETVGTNICPSCKGVKHSLINPTEECQLCNGTGKWLIYDQQKADYLGISARAYRKIWRERLETIKSLIEAREWQAQQRFYKNLFD